MEEKKKCPACGGECQCYYAGDVNAEPQFSNYQYIVDEYCLVCLACGREERRREDGGQTGYMENPTACPFCGVSYRDHRGLDTLKRMRKTNNAW